MVEVFKTNLQQRKAGPVIKALSESFPGYKIDIDLEDTDKVLRIEGKKVSAKEIITALRKEGFRCTVLE